MPPIFVAVALGAASAFMLDPQQGRRRRTLLRDSIARGLREGREFGEAAARDLRARARGAAAQARALRLVPGVKDVDDRLDVHPSAEGISALQGGTPRSGAAIDLPQSRWAPGTRAVAGGAGALLVVYGIARGGAAGVAAVAGGAALLARAKANRPLKEVMRKASPPEPRKRELAAA